MLVVFLSVLGKRLGKDMGKVSNVVKKMTQEQILAFEKSGEVSFFGHCLKLDDIKVMFHIHAVLGLMPIKVIYNSLGDRISISLRLASSQCLDAGKNIFI